MRKANILLAASALMLVCACATSKPVAGAPPAPSVSMAANGNDCAVLGAVARGHYGATRDDPPVRVTLDGESAGERWMADCDWNALGVNYVLDEGPTTPPEMMSMAHVSLHKPKYDKEGALVRTSISPPGQAPSPADPHNVCRVRSGFAGWTAADCKPA
ncbi:MAG: hypothetical protein ABI740_07120 [Alphaproteobacteria bacterium]